MQLPKNFTVAIAIAFAEGYFFLVAISATSIIIDNSDQSTYGGGKSFPFDGDFHTTLFYRGIPRRPNPRLGKKEDQRKR